MESSPAFIGLFVLRGPPHAGRGGCASLEGLEEHRRPLTGCITTKSWGRLAQSPAPSNIVSIHTKELASRGRVFVRAAHSSGVLHSAQECDLFRLASDDLLLECGVQRRRISDKTASAGWPLPCVKYLHLARHEGGQADHRRETPTELAMESSCAVCRYLYSAPLDCLTCRERWRWSDVEVCLYDDH